MADALMAAVRSGAPDTTLPDGSAMHVAREAKASSPASVEVSDPTGDAFRFDQFPAADIRPPHYAADLPFVPDAAVSVGAHDGAPMMFWWGVPDPDRIVAELLRQSADSGWSSDELAAVPVPFAIRTLQLRRGSAQRVIMSMPGPVRMVSLFDKNSAEADESEARSP